MNIDYILSAHGIGGRGKGSISYPEIESFTGKSNNLGTEITLTWKNPTIVEFQKVVMFVADTNISNLSYEDLLSGGYRKEVDGKVSSHTMRGLKHNDKIYFKIFPVYLSVGEELIGRGSSLDVTVKDTVPPGKITNMEIVEDNQMLILSWSNPSDADLSKVVIRYKQENIENIEDGILAYEGKGTSVEIKNLVNEVEYTIRAFTVDNAGNINDSADMIYKATPVESKIYGVVIDEGNANPETRVTYTDDAIGFTPVRGNNGNTNWGSWKDTFIYEKFKPCVVKNGEVQYYLDKEDRTKKVDGSPAVLTGADGDVMVEIDLMWVDLKKVGSNQYVRISDAEQEGFQCLAHTNGDKVVDKIYVGAYLGYEQAGKLRSISGVEPTGSKTIGAFRTIAEANGDRYHQVPFYPLTLLQSIMTIMLKSTDTQTALGRGYADDNSVQSKTGNTNSKGMMYGETSGSGAKSQMCFMGIEDFWGNKRWWIDGCKYDGGSIKTSTSNFNDNASGYSVVGSYTTGGGFIESVKGGMAGFIPDKGAGSNSTYYADYGAVDDGRFPYFGGFRSSGSHAGGFNLNSYSASDSYADLGSRLFMYGKSIE